MGFLARLFARFVPASVRVIPEPLSIPEAAPTSNLLALARVSPNLLRRATVRHQMAQPFASVALATVNLTAEVHLIPLSRFGESFRVRSQIAARFQSVAVEPEPREPRTEEPEPPLLPFDELFFFELDRYPQLDAHATNQLLAEVAAIGSLVEISDGGRSRRARHITSESDKERFRQLRNRLICGHWGLCLKWVREGKWPQRCQSMTEQDLFNEAVFGLARAIELFEPQRDTALGTYAFQWVRQALGRSRAATDRFIRLPIHCLQKSKSTLRRSEYLRLTYILSLSEAAAVGAELLSDPRGSDLSASTFTNVETELSAAIGAILKRLPSREQFILVRRFGLDGQPHETLQQLADSLQLTRERVRQIQARAIKRLGAVENRAILEAVLPD